MPTSLEGTPCSPELRWQLLGEAVRVVAEIAGIQPVTDQDDTSLAAGLAEAGGSRRERFEQAIDDLYAIMGPGIAALLGVKSRGMDASRAAAALWAEYRCARAAALALLQR